MIKDIINGALVLLTPDTFRVLFRGRIRVQVYLSNGQSIKFNCKNFKADPGKSYSYDGADLRVAIDPEQIVAFRRVGWF